MHIHFIQISGTGKVPDSFLESMAGHLAPSHQLQNLQSCVCVCVCVCGSNMIGAVYKADNFHVSVGVTGDTIAWAARQCVCVCVCVCVA